MRNIPRDLVEDKIYCVSYLVYKNEKGDQEFIYLAVRHDRIPSFQEAIRKGNFDAEDYGLILEKGKGEASPTVKEKMKMLYNCDHDTNLSVLDYNIETSA